MFVVTIVQLSPFNRTNDIEQRVFTSEDAAVDWFCERMTHHSTRNSHTFLGAVPTRLASLGNRWDDHNGGEHSWPSVTGSIRYFET